MPREVLHEFAVPGPRPVVVDPDPGDRPSARRARLTARGVRRLHTLTHAGRPGAFVATAHASAAPARSERPARVNGNAREHGLGGALVGRRPVYMGRRTDACKTGVAGKTFPGPAAQVNALSGRTSFRQADDRAGQPARSPAAARTPRRARTAAAAPQELAGGQVSVRAGVDQPVMPVAPAHQIRRRAIGGVHFEKPSGGGVHQGDA